MGIAVVLVQCRAFTWNTASCIAIGKDTVTKFSLIPQVPSRKWHTVHWPEQDTWPSPTQPAESQVQSSSKDWTGSEYLQTIIQSTPLYQSYLLGNSQLKACYEVFPFQFSLTFLMFFSRVCL